jgi:hypothetical protein
LELILGTLKSLTIGALGSIPASSDTVESGGWAMKQYCTQRKKKRKKIPVMKFKLRLKKVQANVNVCGQI